VDEPEKALDRTLPFKSFLDLALESFLLLKLDLLAVG
jgi:hypothetical protein